MDFLKWLADLLAMVLGGSPLILVILAFVQWLKGFKIQGVWLQVASMITGLIFGVGYQLTLGVPVTFTDWFKMAIGGLVWGLAACGVFDAIKAATMKGVEKAITATRLQDD